MWVCVCDEIAGKKRKKPIMRQLNSHNLAQMPPHIAVCLRIAIAITIAQTYVLCGSFATPMKKKC